MPVKHAMTAPRGDRVFPHPFGAFGAHSPNAAAQAADGTRGS